MHHLKISIFENMIQTIFQKIWHIKIPSMDGETSSMDESIICGCHPWMEKCHPWMSSMDGKMSSMDRSVIYGCYPWMTSTDEDNKWRTWTEHKCCVLFWLIIRKTHEFTIYINYVLMPLIWSLDCWILNSFTKCDK